MKGMENGFMEKLLKVLTYDFSILLVKSEMQKTVDTWHSLFATGSEGSKQKNPRVW